MKKVDKVLLRLRDLHTLSEINYIMQGVEDAIKVICELRKDRDQWERIANKEAKLNARFHDELLL